MKATTSAIRIAAGQLATDADLCKMFGLSEQQLEKYRSEIEEARSAAMVHLRYERAKAQARRVKARSE